MGTTDNPLHGLEVFDIDLVQPVPPWLAKGFDGAFARNARIDALAARDRELVDQLQVLLRFGATKVSPIFPFKSDATLKPSSIEILDTSGAVITNFVIDYAQLEIPKSFIKDLKLLLANEFSDPYLSKMELVRRSDPDSGLIRIFIDLEFSARFSVDGTDHIVFTLTSRAYNDSPTGEEASSRDNRPLELSAPVVDGTQFLNSGIIEFEFLGSVHSTQVTSWDRGTLDDAIVGGAFALPINCGRITYTFDRAAGKLTLLSHNQLADLASAVPFLEKVKFFPFDPEATAGSILAKYVVDLNMTAPVDQITYLRRIRRKDVAGQTTFVFIFSYNVYDDAGNFLRVVNVGVAEVGPDTGSRVPIVSLGSNTTVGVEPDWLDEVPGSTYDSFGSGFLRVSSYTLLDELWEELIEDTVEIGSPAGAATSPITVSPEEQPEGTTGVFADADLILLTDSSSSLDGISLDTVGVPITVFERALASAQTRNLQVVVAGEIINNRIVIGSESVMRNFYGIDPVESLINNQKIPLNDEWFEESAGRVKKYLVVSGKRQWRAI